MSCVFTLTLYLFLSIKEGVDLSYRVSFDPHGTGADLWNDLQEDGKLNSTDGKIDKIIQSLFLSKKYPGDQVFCAPAGFESYGGTSNEFSQNMFLWRYKRKNPILLG